MDDDDKMQSLEASRTQRARAIVAMGANDNLYEQACTGRVVVVTGKTGTYHVLMGNLSYSRVLAEERLSRGKSDGRKKWHFTTYTLRSGDTEVDIHLALDSEPWDADVIPSASTIGVPIGCTCSDWRWRSVKHKGSKSTLEEESPVGYAHNGCKHMIAVADAVVKGLK